MGNVPVLEYVEVGPEQPYTVEARRLLSWGLEEEKRNREREQPAGPGISWSRSQDRNAWRGGGGVSDEKVAEKCPITTLRVAVGKCPGNSSSESFEMRCKVYIVQ